MEPKEYLRSLYPKLLAGKISDAELEWLSVYFEGKGRSDLTAMVREELRLSDSDQVTNGEDREVLTRVYASLEQKIGGYGNDRSVARFTSTGWFKFGVAAAVAIVIFGAGLFYFRNQNGNADQVSVARTNDVAPGKVGATLTLSSGQKIRVSDASNGKLAKEAGVTITKTATGQLIYETAPLSAGGGEMPAGQSGGEGITNTLTTAKGETYQVTLPDGSAVWLNAASSQSGRWHKKNSAFNR